MKAEILKLLREADGYVSGQQLCEKFGVCRKKDIRLKLCGIKVIIL